MEESPGHPFPAPRMLLDTSKRSRRRWRRSFVGGLLAACLLAATWSGQRAGPAAAQGPLEPVERRPLPGVVLTALPPEVQVRFSAPLATPLESFNFIVVYDRRGERVDLGLSQPQPQAAPAEGLLLARLRPLNPGIYTVRWRATADGSGATAEGSYSFAVAPRLGSSAWAPLLAVGIAGVLAGMAIGAWLARLRQRETPRG
ncbi:MAG: copper resistance protein CopC [Chloroflexi bacterium]|nr:copper resistance protein CopC [Chloroflexota bacterium]